MGKMGTRHHSLSPDSDFCIEQCIKHSGISYPSTRVHHFSPSNRVQFFRRIYVSNGLTLFWYPAFTVPFPLLPSAPLPKTHLPPPFPTAALRDPLAHTHSTTNLRAPPSQHAPPQPTVYPTHGGGNPLSILSGAKRRNRCWVLISFCPAVAAPVTVPEGDVVLECRAFGGGREGGLSLSPT